MIRDEALGSALAESATALEQLHTISLALQQLDVQTLLPQRLLPSILTKLQDVLGWSLAGILLDIEQQAHSAWLCRAGKSVAVATPELVDGSSAATVLALGRPYAIDDIATDANWIDGDWFEMTAGSVLIMPLVVGNRPVGILYFHADATSAFTSTDLTVLTTAAHQVALMLTTAQAASTTSDVEQRYLSLFEDNIDPVLLSHMSGHIFAANRKAIEFLGYTLEELTQMSVLELHQTSEDSTMSTRASGVLIFTSEVCTKDGSRIPVEVHAKTISTKSGEVLQWIERDISEQVELEQMRQDLTAMLFHDLQSPLGNVLGSLEIAEMELHDDTDPAVREMLSVATDSGRRLQALIRSLLDINKLEASQSITNQRMVEIEELVADARRLVATSMERRQIRLQQEIAPNVPPVYVDADMISRVLLNLLDNCLKYTPYSSEVTLRISEPDADGMLTVAVSDQGKGIPVAFRRTIFDKFRRLKGEKAPRGLGLGLAFCRLAVEAHGGRIWIDDAPGGGARFNLTLPTRPIRK